MPITGHGVESKSPARSALNGVSVSLLVELGEGLKRIRARATRKQLDTCPHSKQTKSSKGEGRWKAAPLT